MSASILQIVDLLNNFAPLETAMSYDNVGLLIGGGNDVNKVLCCLDVTDNAINVAIDKNIDLIVSHHPLIFDPLSKITVESAQCRRIIRLIQNGISVYCSHTNFDAADGGTNDLLFKKLMLINKENLMVRQKAGDYQALGRIGYLDEELSLNQFSAKIAGILKLQAIKTYSNNGEHLINKIALCGGSGMGAEFIQAVKESGCDAYVTGDVKYHDALSALDLGFCVIDATHFATESLAADGLKEIIERLAAQNGYEVEVFAHNETAPWVDIVKQL